MIDGALTNGERVICRDAIQASWLGEQPELVLSDRRIVLLDRVSGATANLPLQDIQVFKQVGRELRIRTVPGRCWIDFAGRRFDGWYVVAFADEMKCIEVANRFRRVSIALGHRSKCSRINQTLRVLSNELGDTWRHLQRRE